MKRTRRLRRSVRPARGRAVFPPAEDHAARPVIASGDEEVIGGLKITPVLSLMSMRGATTDAQIDILNEENADSYWQRSDQFDMGLHLTSGKRGR